MKYILAILLLIITGSAASAQKGSAESGYYPSGYGGDTWTGVVTKTNPDTREITLTYTGKNRTETFEGVVDKRCPVRDGNKTVGEVTNIEKMMGQKIKVYYMRKDVNVNGNKTKINNIFQLALVPDKS